MSLCLCIYLSKRVIRSLKDLFTNQTFLFYFFIHLIINIEAQFSLLLEFNLMEFHLLLLSEAEDTPRSLVHERRSPPRAREDTTVKVLEVDARARAVDLSNHDNMLRPDEVLDEAADVRIKALVEKGVHFLRLRVMEMLHRLFRSLHDIFALVACEIARLGEDLLNGFLALKALTKEVDLILEITEDDLSMASAIAAEHIEDLLKLGGVH